MKFNVITLMPEMVQSFFQDGVVGQALKKNLLALECTNPRQFVNDVHKTVDDRPFGGGDGMIMLPEPLHQSILTAKAKMPQAQIIYLSAQGKKWSDKKARAFAGKKELILICGRYGGIDQRVLNAHNIEEISVGDYVLSGGELAAGILIDSIARMVPGVLGHQASSREDSFAEGILEQPNFTRPREWNGQVVPEILLSGNHLEIAKWKLKVAKLITLQKRPDLIDKNEIKDIEACVKALSAADKKVLGLKDFYG